MRVGGEKRRVADHVLHAVGDAAGEAGGGAGNGAAGGPGDVAEGGAEGDHAVPAVEQVLRPPLLHLRREVLEREHQPSPPPPPPHP